MGNLLAGACLLRADCLTLLIGRMPDLKESKLSQNRDIDTKKAHIVNLIKGIPTLVKRGTPAHQQHINSKRVGASVIDAGMPYN